MLRRVPWAAGLASFAAWLVPVVGPHALFPTGLVLLFHGSEPRARLLQAAAVLALQLVLFAVVLPRRFSRAVRAAVFAVTWLAGALALNAAFLVAIPVATLIEEERRPERTDLAEECRAEGVALDPRAAPDGSVLLRPDRGPKLLRLRLPGCLAEPTGLDLDAALPPRGDDRTGPRDRRLVVPAGFLAWDVYAEGRRYVVEWEVHGRRGVVEVPRGSGVVSAALDDRGRYVAYSTSTTLNVGNTRDAVVVVRTSDGQEVYRRSRPRYDRAEVALIGDLPWFATTEVSGSTSMVRVFRLP